VSVTGVIAQLRTTDLERAVRFYTAVLGFALDFRYEDFYAGVRAGRQSFHLKLVDEADPSIAFVRTGEHFHLYFETGDIDSLAANLEGKGIALVRAVHDTPWGTRELALRDADGHTLYFGQRATTMRT
jgi:catechol 2,3-dioxygenase-like lactoylglutathione lyase family enzyme